MLEKSKYLLRFLYILVSNKAKHTKFLHKEPSFCYFDKDIPILWHYFITLCIHKRCNCTIHYTTVKIKSLQTPHYTYLQFKFASLHMFTQQFMFNVHQLQFIKFNTKFIYNQFFPDFWNTNGTACWKKIKYSLWSNFSSDSYSKFPIKL